MALRRLIDCLKIQSDTLSFRLECILLEILAVFVSNLELMVQTPESCLLLQEWPKYTILVYFRSIFPVSEDDLIARRAIFELAG